MVFKTSCGRSFLFYHSQDCCESVQIDEVEGNLEDLVGSPITEALEDIQSGEASCGDTYTNTTFTFATSKGRVVVKWVGSSNGYYSESVSFVETTAGGPRW